jgi:menaquinone-dependent protoporphyrinogen oxidase
MDNRVLVSYASQGGSTAGVADAVADAIRKSLSANSTLVDVRPVKEVIDLSPYRAVMIGSAVHSGKWMPEAMRFIERNQSILRHIPTAVFQVCMMLATSNEQYRHMVPDWLAPLRAQIHPVAEASFAGALWPNQYTKLSDKIGLRIFLTAIKLKAGDYRDWDAIRGWAERVGPLLSQ